MQPAETPTQSNWPDSLATMEYVEEAEAMAQLLSSYSLSGEASFPSLFSTENGTGDSSYYNGGGHLAAASYYWPQDHHHLCRTAATKADGAFLLAGMENCYLNDAGATPTTMEDSSATMDFFVVTEEAAGSAPTLIRPPRPRLDLAAGNGETCNEHFGVSGAQKCSPKRKLRAPPSPPEMLPVRDDARAPVTGSPIKKSRSAADLRKDGKSLQQHASPKGVDYQDAEETNITGAADQKEMDCSSDSSEEDGSSASQDTATATATARKRPLSRSASSSSLSHHGNSRPGRMSATDPQSLYARKRRERINERLKILQNLVPNGTKVDISTMLEEAVQYVKFLQLQIKLLSSDDLWMYAPIAYNGMDIGLDLMISPSQSLRK